MFNNRDNTENINYLNTSTIFSGDHEPFKCSQCRRPMNGQSTVVEIEPIKPYSPHDHSVPIPKERTAPSIPKSNPADSSWINKPQMPSKSVNPVKELESLGRVRAVGVNISISYSSHNACFNFYSTISRVLTKMMILHLIFNKCFGGQNIAERQ